MLVYRERRERTQAFGSEMVDAETAHGSTRGGASAPTTTRGAAAATDVPTAGLARVRAASRADAVLDALRDAIVTGVLAPGQRIYEAQLAEQLGVSRTPVREALRRLAEAHLVELEVSRTYHVTPLDPDRLRSVFDVYAELLGLAARLATPLLTADDKAAIRARGRAFIEQPVALSPGGGRPRIVSDLVDVLLARLGDVVVTQAVETYRPHVARAIELAGHTLEPAAIATWFGGIVAALDEADGELLAASVRAYVVQLGKQLVGAIGADGASAP